MKYIQQANEPCHFSLSALNIIKGLLLTTMEKYKKQQQQQQQQK